MTRMADLPTTRRHCLSDDDAIDPKRALPLESGLVIERDVPPPNGKRYGRWNRVAVKMHPGDSVLVQTSGDAYGLCRAIRRDGGKCTQRRELDGRFRVWRTA